MSTLLFTSDAALHCPLRQRQPPPGTLASLHAAHAVIAAQPPAEDKPMPAEN